MTSELTVLEKDNQLVVSSIDVAEMIDKEHKALLKDIRKYMEYLGKGKIALSDFFVEGSYISSQNKVLPCYFLTRKGCDMVANKMTGEKGVLFTATYVDRFYEMEEMIKQDRQPKVPQTYKEALIALVEAGIPRSNESPKTLCVGRLYLYLIKYSSLLLQYHQVSHFRHSMQN